MKRFFSLQEDLRNWFNPNHPKGDWKRINSKGEAIGPCAREPGEPKPKCMSRAQRDSLSKKERASAVRRKRAQDPNPERKGEPINVKAKVNEDMEILNEKNKPTNPELWSRAISLAKSKFDVYPSAYANGWASKWYKSKGGSWRTVSEAVKDKYDEGEYDQEGDMAKSDLRSIIANAKELHDMIDDAENLPEWCQSKITLAEDYISTVTNYMTAEMSEGVQPIKEAKSAAVRLAMALQREREKRERGERAGAALLRPKQPEQPMKKEEVVNEVMDEPNYKNSIQARQKKADDAAKRFMQSDNKPPFDGPYKKSTGVVTDKSGAKHGGMSIARNLAKQAMKKQASKMSVKEGLEESRKAEIVKEIIKKGKKKDENKFESEPELGSTVVKADN